MIGEYGTSATNVIAERIWMTPEVSSSGLFGGDDGTGGYAPIAIVTGTTLSWVHGNHLGVPQVYTNATGAVIATPAYTLPGFPGQFRTLADIYYNKYRDYDISTGRYIQADPIGLSGGTSPYLYANGNPVWYTDSSGLFLDTLADIAFIGYDIYRIVNDNVLGNGKEGSFGTNLGALGLDVGGALIPGVTGLGPGSRVARGTAQVTKRGDEITTHGSTSERIAREMAESGQYDRVHMNQEIRTITEGANSSRVRPDVAGVRPDGRIDAVEVLSPGQRREQMEAKLNNALGSRCNSVVCINPD